MKRIGQRYPDVQNLWRMFLCWEKNWTCQHLRLGSTFFETFAMFPWCNNLMPLPKHKTSSRGQLFQATAWDGAGTPFLGVSQTLTFFFWKASSKNAGSFFRRSFLRLWRVRHNQPTPVLLRHINKQFDRISLHAHLKTKGKSLKNQRLLHACASMANNKNDVMRRKCFFNLC